MSAESSRAVFLSYASQDAAAVQRIAEALRAAGVELWFDQNELVGGDAWDGKIRGQIASCALFVPIISANTQARREGYFRLEWKLADERTHLMAEGTPFLLPVVIDDTKDREALVPKSFLHVQWTRLPVGEPLGKFCERVRNLLTGSSGTGVPPVSSEPGRDAPATPIHRNQGRDVPATQTAPRPAGRWLFPAALGLAACAAIAIWQPWKSKASPTLTATVATAAPNSAAPTSASAKSIAVLPFENRSPEADKEFFADGMHDEVITALSKIRDLTVIARASVLAYRKPEGRNLKQIAAELGVANVLEGRVQQAGKQVKVTVELIAVRTGALLWGDSFTEDVTDVFTIQAKIAAAITSALKATLAPGEKLAIERRPTQNVAAYEFYLRAKVADGNLTPRSSREDFEQVASLYQQAVALDPEFALAYARLTHVHGLMYWFGTIDPTPAR
ncbi:MAG: TIR domain-containing protein, partial [Opitutaceae bacterium]